MNGNRKEAIATAHEIAGRITDPSKVEVIEMHLRIVRGQGYSDREAWDSVQALYFIDPLAQPCSGCGAAQGEICRWEHADTTRIHDYS